ncbi:MAG: diguanylate cyclase [SAR324 cluster bacterium]|nr:diguanylate cyclase [SAR324 cluster bacterium]
MAKILLIDDYEDSLTVTSLILGQDIYDIITAEDGHEGLEKAEREQPDVIILDIQMPAKNGFEVCQELKKNKKTAHIPVVFLTAKYKDSESLTKGLAMGAEDYIVKPCKPPELRARIRVLVRLKKNMDELAQKNRELDILNQQLEGTNNELLEAQKNLEELAITDPLTSLNNRRYFTERLQEEFLRTLRNQQEISLIMLDIDYFKKINDNYGHPCGDSVLLQYATILKKNLRQHDIVARFGGEEFVIGMVGQSLQDAYSMAERIRQDVEQFSFQHDDHTLHITCSAGVGSYPEICSDSPSLDAMLREVDAALYYAKNNGRNQVIIAPVSKTADNSA